MKVPSHIVGLYNRSVRKYRKLTIKLRRETNPAGYTYQILLNKLRKLRRKIVSLQLQLKIATASGALALALNVTPVQAQTTHNGPFVQQPRHLNPLREPFKFDGNAYPTAVDLDKDGDYDVVVGHEGNYYYSYYDPAYSTIEPLRYLLNTGTNTDPSYEEKTGAENPFNDIRIVNRNRGPVFADIDEDGDEDLFVGLRYSFSNNTPDLIVYFRNDGGVFNEQTGPWDPATKTGNPFAGLNSNDGLKLAFVDLDKDGDLDAIIAGTAIDDVTGSARYISYYKNDGEGTFTDATSEVTFSPAPTYSGLNPTVADLDKDGDADLVLGGYYLGNPGPPVVGSLFYYKQVSPGNFVQQTGTFDPALQTGNPFESFYKSETHPVFVDLDNDSDIDLLVGDGDGDQYYRYPNSIIHFFENTGNSVFEKRVDLANPFGGVDLRRDASPVLLDLDGDNDLDALIGHKYEDYFVAYNIPAHYVYEDNKFTQQQVEDSSFGTIELAGTLTPSVGDIDADGDLDFITGEEFGGVSLFRNDNGEFTHVLTGSPVEGISVVGRASTELADVDADGDLDLIVGSGAYGAQVRYFKNTGTPQNPVFEEQLDPDNPFSVAGSTNPIRGYVNLADVDHDGDLDLLVTEYFYFKYYDFDQIVYYENTGTATAPVFQLAEEQPFLPDDTDPFATLGSELQPYLADQDGDGDLDLFAGDGRGFIKYVKNENPAVAATLATGTLSYRVGVDAEITLDPTLTLSDEDNDLVVQVTVGISNHQEGDELHFAPQGNISGVFNPSTGVLTLKGKGTLADYQTILRTIAYHHHEPTGGRTRPMKKSITAKTIEYRVYDSDFTTPQVATRNVNVIFNSPPVIQSTTQTTELGFTVSVGLAQLLSDPDDNINTSTLRIVQQPASGAAAIIDANLNLVIDYDGVNFSGTDILTIEVCDDLGECTQNIITIDVQTSGEIEVFNAVAPNSPGDNRFMRIHNLPEGNKVSIFSRWGDKVFEVADYDSGTPGRRFDGRNDNGKTLPSGTYFYTIEIPGKDTITGYLTLKQ